MSNHIILLAFGKTREVFHSLLARLWSIRKSSEKLASFSGEAGEASFSELFCAQQTLISRAFPRFSGRTVGMPLQTLHFAYLPDERAFLSERPFYKGKPRLKVRLIPESRCQAADIYFCGGLDSAPLCENWSEIAQK